MAIFGRAGQVREVCAPRSLAAEPRPSGLALPGLLRQPRDMTVQPPIPFAPQSPEQVSFDRHELGQILTLYGRMVALGEWRDYGISHLRDVAVFSIFRRTAESPLYRIEKRPKLRARQGMYAVVAMDGQILRRGQDLAQVLRVLERKLIRPVD
ncbi:hypothetical protein Rsph17029_2794 [Rhodobacter sphaeroides ATCC 17029]|nr:hypothetical protein Rsph17029_2794 [Cereibacter sphaeroides ATCC 17029]